MWTLLKHSRSRYLVVLHVRCSASKTLESCVAPRWWRRPTLAQQALARPLLSSERSLACVQGEGNLKTCVKLGFWIDCIAVLQHLNPGMISRCTQRLFTCTARPSTTRFLRALSWGSFYFLTRWNLKLLCSLWMGLSTGPASNVLLRESGPPNQTGSDALSLPDFHFHAG